jgi:hypothetical protein
MPTPARITTTLMTKMIIPVLLLLVSAGFVEVVVLVCVFVLVPNKGLVMFETRPPIAFPAPDPKCDANVIKSSII